MLMSCGSKEGSAAGEAIPTEQESQLDQALESNDMGQMSEIADSLALRADDLTPAQAVKVLDAFVKMEIQASKAGNRRKVQETMRKFVDLYDIVFENDASGMRSAVRAMGPVEGKGTLAEIFQTYVAMLQNDAVPGEEEAASEEASEPTDSLTQDLEEATTNIPETPAADEPDLNDLN